jgi:hypothetical protein
MHLSRKPQGLQAFYSVAELARMAHVSADRMRRALRCAGVVMSGSGRVLYVTLSEVQRRIPPLWETLCVLEHSRRCVVCPKCGLVPKSASREGAEGAPGVSRVSRAGPPRVKASRGAFEETRREHQEDRSHETISGRQPARGAAAAGSSARAPAKPAVPDP